MVVLGIKPTRAETGYGYIETGEVFADGVLRVRRFTEKPNRERAEEFVAAGNYHWNSGIFVWSARTLANAVREHLPEMAPLLEKIAAAYGTPDFDRVFRELYPTVRKHQRRLRDPRAALGERRTLAPISTACLPTSAGTTSDPGRRSTSISSSSNRTPMRTPM